MTVQIISSVPNRETQNAEWFKHALLQSEPKLNHPDIVVYILCGLPLPGREIDLVVLYHDKRVESEQLKTPNGNPIHSFVLVVEVKQHSPALIKFEGTKVLVRYDQLWTDATEQCDQQTWALKRYQAATYKGKAARNATFVQRTIWLARAPNSAFDGVPATGSVPVQFAQLDWNALTAGFILNRHKVKTLVDEPSNPKYHSIDTLFSHLMYKVNPTRLDLRRVDALTLMRFDAEKTAYIQAMGTGLLLLRGRAGTGKTFALLQIALHLARQGKRTVMLTYNHGLIADINRALRFIGEKSPDLQPLPKVQTRYTFIRDIFQSTFGQDAENIVVKSISAIADRELYRTQAILDTNKFLGSVVPANGAGDEDKKVWKDIVKRPCPPIVPYEYVFIDEGQDWSESHRKLVYDTLGPEHVVVADGVNQFVGPERCQWDCEGIPINRRHSLRASRRTKAATCQTVGEIARKLGMADWDLEPDLHAHGGRFTVIVEPDPRKAVERGLNLLDEDYKQDSSLKAVDNLICLPSAKMAGGVNYSAIFDSVIENTSRDSWRGFDEESRRTYPVRDGQLRAIQYSSCRGMEGWTTICLGLDTFFEFQMKNSRIDEEEFASLIRDRDGLLYSPDTMSKELFEKSRAFAIDWLMIPITRSIDHIIVHITDHESHLGKILNEVSADFPGSIEWVT